MIATQVSPRQLRSACSRISAVVGLGLLAIAGNMLPPVLFEAQQADGQQRRGLRRPSYAPSDFDRSRPDRPSRYPATYVPPYQPPVQPYVPAPVYDYYAAIAYSVETGKWGYAYNYYSRGDAEASALSRCDAPDAKPIVWARNACCVLAVGDGKIYAYAWHTNRAEAERIALTECQKRTTNCRIACWTSTDR